jgi:hypothetical protein
LAYPFIKYNGGLFVSLLRKDNHQFEEKYTPGTQVERIDPITNMLLSGTVIDIPFPLDVSASSEDSMDLLYTIFFDDGSTASIPLSQMAKLIPPPPITPSVAEGNFSLLPPFL